MASVERLSEVGVELLTVIVVVVVVVAVTVVVAVVVIGGVVRREEGGEVEREAGCPVASKWSARKQGEEENWTGEGSSSSRFLFAPSSTFFSVSILDER